MKTKSLTAILLCAALLPLGAQVSDPIDALRQQLQQVRDAFEKSQAEYRRQIDELTRKLDEVSRARGQTNAVIAGQPALPTNTAAAERQKLEQQLAAEIGAITQTNAPAAASAPATWSPAQPMPLVRAGSAYMNISFDALVNFGWSTARDPGDELQLGGHDPDERGFSLRNAEIAFDGAVDPYFKGFANTVLLLDERGDTEIELEEAFLQTTALPANLQLKAGQFFGGFGRQNQQHPHAWAFVDQPIILNRAFGPDGLRNPGAQLSWLAPLPFFTELSLGVFNGVGETAYSFRNAGENDGTGVDRFAGRATLDRELRGVGDLLFVPRLSTSFDLTEEQTIVAGASAAFGPNDTGPRTRTQIYGLDWYWKWKSPRARAGFPFVAWQTEALYRRFEAGADAGVPLNAEVLRDYGLYSQLLWGFRPRWTAGLRGEWATGNNTLIDGIDVGRGDRTRLSPALTWYPTEFSKIRVQYNYDQGQHFADEHSVWVQLEFLLGAHGAHQF